LSYNSSEKVVKLELNLCGFNRKFLRIKHGGDELELLPTDLFLPCGIGGAGTASYGRGLFLVLLHEFCDGSLDL